MEHDHHAHRPFTPPPDLQAGTNLDFWPDLIKRRVLMHPSETSAEPDKPVQARFVCQRCGLQTEWLSFRTQPQAARPRPCPTCNAPEKTP